MTVSNPQEALDNDAFDSFLLDRTDPQVRALASQAGVSEWITKDILVLLNELIVNEKARSIFQEAYYIGR